MKQFTPVLCILACVCIGCSKSSERAEAPKDAYAEPPVIEVRDVDTRNVPSPYEFATTEAAPTPIAASRQPVRSQSLAPDAVVAQFLTALRDGDDSVAESLLTKKALEETSKRQLQVQPPGTPSAQFQVGNVSYVTPSKRGAHVSCIWREQGPSNQSVSYEIVWALRHEQEGWKIAGMATQVTQSGPPVFLNFEDPDDMLAKWREAEKALAAQYEDDGVRQASRTDAEPDTGRFQR